MTNTCLLIIDVQQILFDEKDPSIYKGNEVLDNISTLIDHARTHEYPIIYIQHTDEDGPMQRHLPAWEFHEQIKPTAQDHVVEKSSWDGFLDTKLDETLKALGVDTLVIAGMQTEFCLDTTLRRAYSMGYKSTVIADGHTTFDNPVLNAAQIIQHHNRIWNGRFAQVVSIREFLK